MKFGRIEIDRKFVFTVVVGIMMITWAMGLALSYNIKVGDTGMKIESVYDRPLTGQEKVTILKTGKVLIEYLYTSDDPASAAKLATYENFVGRFQDFVVLEEAEVGVNQTMEQMISPTGDVIPLHNVTDSSLIDIFCQNTVVQPRECLMRSI